MKSNATAPRRIFLSDPGTRARKGERALRALTLELDDRLEPAWTIIEGASWSEGGPAKAPQEFDLLALHPEAGIVVVEAKAARISFDPLRGWMFGGVPWGESSRGRSASPLEQVDRARRNLIAGMRKLGIAPDRYLSVGRGLAILEGSRWWKEGTAPAPGLLGHEVLVGSDQTPADWVAAFAAALRQGRRRGAGEPGGLTAAETRLLLESFGFSGPSAAPLPRRQRSRGSAIDVRAGRPVAFGEALQLWMPDGSSPVMMPSPLVPFVQPLAGDERIADAIASAAGLEEEPRKRLGQVVRHRVESMPDEDILASFAATKASLGDAALGGAAYDSLSRGIDLLLEVARLRGLRLGIGGGKRRSPMTAAIATLKLAIEPFYASPALAANRIRAAVHEAGVDCVVDRIVSEPERFGKLRIRRATSASQQVLKTALDHLVAASEAA